MENTTSVIAITWKKREGSRKNDTRWKRLSNTVEKIKEKNIRNWRNVAKYRKEWKRDSLKAYQQAVYRYT